jgi:hypothetical protein
LNALGDKATGFLLVLGLLGSPLLAKLFQSCYNIGMLKALLIHKQQSCLLVGYAFKT